MTFSPTKDTPLTEEEWTEMVALKEAIKYYPHAISPEDMEKFTSFLVRSFNERSCSSQ
jgi:hypothetical protein